MPPIEATTLEGCQLAADAWLRTPLADVDAIAIGATCYKGVDPNNPQIEAQKDPA